MTATMRKSFQEKYIGLKTVINHHEHNQDLTHRFIQELKYFYKEHESDGDSECRSYHSLSITSTVTALEPVYFEKSLPFEELNRLKGNG